MKTWWVEYIYRIEGIIRGYTVVAEDDEAAGQVGYENLEVDEANNEIDTRKIFWSIQSVALVEVCSGCGGYRKVVSPAGEGAVL